MSKFELVFATNNKNKIQEIQSLVNDQFKILSLKEIGCNQDLVESKSTLEGNSLQKAKYIFDNFKYNCFADDTGLEIDSLNGEPGVYSARYAGTECDAEKNIIKVLNKLKNETRRNARFITVITLLIGDNKIIFKGICEGKITYEKKGKGGFGYDPIFIPNGYNKTFSQMSSTEKNKISHRGLAVKKLINFLLKIRNL